MKHSWGGGSRNISQQCRGHSTNLIQASWKEVPETYRNIPGGEPKYHSVSHFSSHFVFHFCVFSKILGASGAPRRGPGGILGGPGLRDRFSPIFEALLGGSWPHLWGQDEGPNLTFLFGIFFRGPPGSFGRDFLRTPKQHSNIEASWHRFFVDFGRVLGWARGAKIVFSYWFCYDFGILGYLNIKCMLEAFLAPF